MNYKGTIQVGDIVTGYHKGYWRVTDVDYTAGRSSNGLVTYERVLDANRNPCRKSTKSCDISYCRKIDKQNLIEQIELNCKAFRDGFERLIDLL